MSTKIYNGYIFNKKVKNLNQAHKVLKKIRLSIELEAKKILSESAGRISVSIMDSLKYDCLNEKQIEVLNTLKSNGYSNSLLNEVIWAVDKNVKDDVSSPYRMNYEYDLNCSVYLYELQNRVLLLYYGQRPEFLKIFENHELIEDYHYQNQVDEPEDVSLKDFNKRGRDWNKVLGDMNPIQSGLKYTLLDISELWSLLPKYDDILKTKISLKDRKEWLTKSLIRKEPSYPIMTKEDDVNSFYKKFREWTETEEYKNLFSKINKSIKIKSKYSKKEYEKNKVLSLFEKATVSK
jgi:hypothetical protein